MMSEPVSLKILAAETGLHASTAHRILASLIQNRFVEKATPNRMIHVQQLVGSRAPLHVTAVGKLGYALDNEEAELAVGCIGVLLYDSTGNVSAGLSVSAPIERRRLEWTADLVEAAERISAQLGHQPPRP